jgi:PAS domain S-box-containing protein
MTMRDGFVYVDMEGVIREANESLCEMTGYTTAELSDLTYRDLTPRRWHAMEQEIVERQVIPKGYSAVYEKEYIRKDGTVFPVELRTVLIRSESGENAGMWAIIRDITGRKMVEEKLLQSDYWLRESQRIGRLGSYTFDFATGTFEASPVLDEIFGIEADTEKNLELWTRLVHPDHRQEMLDYFLHDIAGKGKPFNKEYRIVRVCDGVIRWVWGQGILSFDDGGRPLAMFGVIQDITEQMQIREALSLSEIEHRNTLDALPEWIYVVDENRCFVMLNAPMKEELQRLGLSDRIGKPVVTGYPLITNKTIVAIDEVFSSGIPLISEEHILLSDKKLFAEIRIVPIFKNSRVEKVVTLIRDRSREKEVEELKQKNTEQKEILLREIHHRVKNNLAIVISLLNFQLRNNPDPELGRIIRDIQFRIRSMALIHEHLYRSENLDRIPLAAYIHSLASIILSTFSGHRVNLETHLDEMDASIETALPIGLVINELLTNAFKYAFPTGQTGKIRLKLSRGEKDQCLLVLSDNGVGLPENISMESEDSLGLYIVNLLVEQLDGKVEIVRHQGTTFNIHFRNILTKPSGLYPAL